VFKAQHFITAEHRIRGIEHFSSFPLVVLLLAGRLAAYTDLIDLSPRGNGRCLLGPQWDLLQSAVISSSSYSIVNRLHLLVSQSLTSKQN